MVVHMVLGGSHMRLGQGMAYLVQWYLATIGGVLGPCHNFQPQGPHTVSPGSLGFLAFCHHPQILQGLKTSW